MRLALLPLIAACGSVDNATVGPPPDLGWVSQLAMEPELFTALVNTSSKQGWVAIFQHDYAAAERAFSSDAPASVTGRVRAQNALSFLHADLAMLELAVSGSALDAAPELHAMAADCDGWVSQGDSFPARLELHRAAQSGQVQALTAAGAEPLLVQAEPGFERRWFDPCLHHSLALGWAARSASTRESWDKPGSTPEQGALAMLIFGPSVDLNAMSAESQSGTEAALLGGEWGSFAQRGVASPPADDNPAQAARDEVRALDAFLERSVAELYSLASADGQALLADLRLMPRLRQEWLVVRARQALRQGHIQRADAYLALARDVTERGVGPANSPHLFALTALAKVQGGRSREALDALVLLGDAYPEVEGLRELTGLLAVSDTLGRQGDSKEN